jgi:hypothetical protein
MITSIGPKAQGSSVKRSALTGSLLRSGYTSLITRESPSATS